MFNISFKDVETLYLFSFFGSIIATFLGVAFIIPFFLSLMFILIRYRNKFLSFNIFRLGRKVYFLHMLCICWLGFFLFSVVSNLVVNAGEISGDENLIIIAAFLYFILGYIGAFTVKYKKVISYFSLFLIVSFSVVFGFFYCSPLLIKQNYLHGVFKNINILTSLVLMLAAITWPILWSRESSKISQIFFVLFLGITGCFCTKSATSEMAVPLFLLLLFILSFFLESNKIDVFFVALLIVCIIATILFKQSISESLEKINFMGWEFWREFLNHRDEVWSFSTWMVAKSPLWGIGTGNFSEAYKVLLSEKGLNGVLQHYNHAHMVFWHQAVIHGLPAFFAYIGALFFIFRGIFAALKKEKSHYLGISVLGMWLCFCLYGLVEYAVSFRELVPFMWGNTGLLFGLFVKIQQDK